MNVNQCESIFALCNASKQNTQNATNEAVVQTYSESSFVSSACSFSLSECSLDRYCLIMLSSTCVTVYFLKARYCMKRKRGRRNSKGEDEKELEQLITPKSFKM